MEQINYRVHPKEKIYFFIKLVVALIGYAAIGYGLMQINFDEISTVAWIYIAYAGFIILYLLLRLGFLIGALKGNAVKISEHQLPDIYDVVKRQSAALQLSREPQVYLMQAGGLLNAFATRFIGTNYVVIYSDVLDEAYADNLPAVEFIIGHELGHVKRKHVLKRLLLLPSFIIPFLGAAYSRACEYTCDAIGAALSPKGARNGLILLASGKRLYKKINAQKFMEQAYTEAGFWPWFTEKVSSHPKLSKRVLKFREEQYAAIIEPKKSFKEMTDHSAYFPKVN